MASVTPVAMAHPGTFQVQAPAGAPAGSHLQVTAPNGAVVQVMIPPGTPPGGVFEVTMPPAPVVVVGQPGVAAAPAPPRPNPLDASVGPNAWTHGLLDCDGLGCFDCFTLGLCGGSCRYCDAVAWSGVDPLQFNADRGGRCCIFCLAISIEVVPCQALAAHTMARLAVARKYGIDQTLLGACCVSCWCPCCAFRQVEREVRAQEKLRWGCCGFSAGAAPVASGA